MGFGKRLRIDAIPVDLERHGLATLELLDRAGSPATTATAGGRFFGLVMGGSLPAALGARVLAASWDQAGFNEVISPVAIRLEKIAGRWVLDLLGLPKDASVGFCTGATMGNFLCLAAARHALLERQGWNVERDGLFGAPKLRVIASAQSHVTIGKALGMLGVGTASVQRVSCDDNGAILDAAMPEVDAGTLVIAQAGNVNSGAIDPIGAIAARIKGSGAWLHVDGAFGFWAAASATTAHLLRGAEMADSWVVDSHKWLNTPYDCGMAICRHPQAIHAAMATQATYLAAGGKAPPKDMVPEFSRAARGVEVWAALHSLGRQGVADLIERCCAHARQDNTLSKQRRDCHARLSLLDRNRRRGLLPPRHTGNVKRLAPLRAVRPIVRSHCRQAGLRAGCDQRGP
jgi:glutamate/tyrosine decarboxylase-like PLP-dependent enzyme